jgi:hypothetical protein
MMKLYYVECLDDEGYDYATTIFGNSVESAIVRIKELWDEHEIVGHTALDAQVYES